MPPRTLINASCFTHHRSSFFTPKTTIPFDLKHPFRGRSWIFKFLNRSIDVEGHGFTVGALVNVFRTNVIDAAASEAASLGDKNRAYLRRLHGAVGVRMH